MEAYLLALNDSLADTLDVPIYSEGKPRGDHAFLTRVQDSDLPLAFEGGAGVESAIGSDTFTGASGIGIIEYWPHHGAWTRLQRVVRSGAASDTVDLRGLRVGTLTIKPFSMPTDAEMDAIIEEIERDFAPPPPAR